MARVAVYVIHNRDDRRLAYLRPALEALRHRVPDLGPAQLIGYQVPLSGSESASFRVAQWGAWRWEKYCAARHFERHPGLGARLRKARTDGAALWRALFRPMSEAERRVALIHIVLTDKHLRALADLMESDADFAIVCEDDVVITEETPGRLQAVLDLAAAVDAKRYIYVDLGGGFSIPALKVGALAIGGQAGDPPFLHRFRKMVTNTTCAYLINRAYAERLYGVVMRSPALRRLSIPRFYNTAARMTHDIETGAGLFALTVPSVVQHGSASGHYETSIRPVVFT